jgi:hypothetical protein
LLTEVQVTINVGGGLGLQDGATWTLTNLKINSSGGGTTHPPAGGTGNNVAGVTLGGKG